MDNKLLIYSCSFLAPEIAHVIKNSDFPDVQLMNCAANCTKNTSNNHPITEMVTQSAYSKSDMIIINSGCRFLKIEENKNIREIHLDQGFEIFINRETVAHYITQGYYLVTNGWLRMYDQHIRKWGFDSNTAKTFFRESMKGILFLDTTIAGDYMPNLIKLSEYMGLPYEVLPVGLSHCKTFIDSLVINWRNESEHKALIEKLSVKSKQTADYSIIFNQLEILVNLTDEKQIIQVGFDLLNSLYAPSHIVFTRLLNKHNERFEFNGIYNNQPQKSENCFEIKVYHSNKVLGIFEINGIQFPQYLSEYKKTGVLLSYLLGLAIANARKYEITIEQKKQLEAFSLELQKTNNSKDKFFSILAHDLSSPFHSLLGMSEFLNTEIEKGNIEKVKKFSDTIYQTITKTYNLLTNLLDWAQSQTGKIQFKPELFFLSEIVDEIILLLNAQAENKTITLNNLIHADLSVYADKNMLSTVIRNLVSNAIKYSNKNGIITISASGNEHIRQISVSDNGIGISLENIEKLFQIEKVISRPGTHEETGTGLGLILCKEFIEKHDGEIWVESDIGKGSIFHFTLPVKNSK